MVLMLNTSIFTFSSYPISYIGFLYDIKIQEFEISVYFFSFVILSNIVFAILNKIIMKKAGIILIFTLILSGCASVYRPIKPGTLDYSNPVVGEKITYACRYNVLKDAGNVKYAKIEYKHRINLLAVKIINNTDSAINISKNVKFYIGNTEYIPLEPYKVAFMLSQKVMPYINYCFLFFSVMNNKSGLFIPIPIGLPIGIGNMMYASSNNKKLANEINQCYLTKKIIQPRETVYGLIGFYHIDNGKIEMRITQ